MTAAHPAAPATPPAPAPEPLGRRAGPYPPQVHHRPAHGLPPTPLATATRKARR